ncbi:unnamed protein product [Moneuplotes crassus]|uniref:Uncharacterized protein n=1 Tax=Euplotes crassus TaxID=5936 RepID=A0AAD1XY99_EUPCR|nr:unnamed protein product [Moneuplotes crassus]
MENFVEDKENFGTRSNKVMLLIDSAVFTLVTITYLASRNQSCEANIEDFILTYIIFKGLFCTFRFTIWLIDKYVSQVGSYCLTFYLIIWMPTMGVYYILELVHFFSKDTNDCLNNASMRWTSSLIITIEAFICLAFDLGVLIALAVWASWLIIKSCRNPPRRVIDVTNMDQTYNVDSKAQI